MANSKMAGALHQAISHHAAGSLKTGVLQCQGERQSGANVVATG